MRTSRFIAILFTAAALASCTAQRRARQFGGVAKVEVTAGHKVIGATWKDSDLWIIHRPMRDGEVPEVVTMTESSSWGALEGTVVLHERAAK